jgi:hypothetical protein
MLQIIQNSASMPTVTHTAAAAAAAAAWCGARVINKWFWVLAADGWLLV